MKRYAELHYKRFLQGADPEDKKPRERTQLGDAMNGILLIENAAVEAFSIMHPAMRIRATNEAAIGRNISLPKQTLVVANSFLQD